MSNFRRPHKIPVNFFLLNVGKFMGTLLLNFQTLDIHKKVFITLTIALMCLLKSKLLIKLYYLKLKEN